MNHTKLTIVVIVSLLLIPAIACGGSSGQPAVQEPAQQEQPPAPQEPAQQQQEPPPTDTPVPPPPTDTPVPEPVYQDPVVLLEHSGTGETVSDNFGLPVCQKAVFKYSVQAGPTGYASLILKFNRVGGDREMTLVNDMEEVPQMTGQTIQSLVGGDYFFTSENTDESWQITVECQDMVAPVADGLDVSGDTPAVTANYHLHACQKSVFVWETQPGPTNYASIIARLAQTNIPELRGGTLANDMKEGPLQGESLQAIEEGDYFIVVENISGPWHIRWECRD